MTKADYPETQIFYESPYRVKETLTNLLACYGDRQVVLVRELTKLFEEYQRGQISEVLTYLADHPLKGECLLIVAGANQTDASEPAEDLDLLALVQEAIAAGLKPNQAIKAVAKDYKVNRQELYQQFHGLG